MHLSSVHSWCHFITHILNISKHSFKCVCVCVLGGRLGCNLTGPSALSASAVDGCDFKVRVKRCECS